MIDTLVIVGYLAAALFTGRLVADRMYRGQQRDWPSWSFQRNRPFEPEWEFIVPPAVLAAVFWPAALPVLAVGWAVVRSKRWFVPTIAADERAEQARIERQDRAASLRASALLLDDPSLRQTLLDAARDLENADA